MKESKELKALQELLKKVRYDDDDPYDYACEHGVWVDSETYIPFDGEGFRAQQRFNGTPEIVVDSQEEHWYTKEELEEVMQSYQQKMKEKYGD